MMDFRFDCCVGVIQFGESASGKLSIFLSSCVILLTCC